MHWPKYKIFKCNKIEDIVLALHTLPLHVILDDALFGSDFKVYINLIACWVIFHDL